MQALARARADLDAGRLWKARDRLRGAFAAKPSDQEVLFLLGEVLFAMGDLPEAGRYWTMTAHSGDEFDAAYAALLERHGSDPIGLACAIPVRADLDELPPEARARLLDLRAAAEAKAGRPVNVRWGRRPRDTDGERPRTTLFAKALIAVGIVIFLAVLLGLAAVAVTGIEVFLSLF